MNRIAPIILVLLCAALPQLALAAGNVLLPTTNNTNATLPDLGIAPTPPAAPAISVPTSPAPAASAPDSPAVAAEIPEPRIDPEALKHLAPGAIPTRVMHQQDMSDILAQTGKGLPYTLAISLGSRSVFGSRDVEEIGHKLGLSRDQIASSCFLTVKGILQTDKGGYIFDSVAKPQTTVSYAGTIRGYMMSAAASCAAPAKLPADSGFLSEVGNRFSVPLNAINCDAPKRQAAALVVTYDGNGPAQCQYQ